MSNQSFKSDSPAVNDFLARKTANPAEKFAALGETLASALEKPDGPPSTPGPVLVRNNPAPATIDHREEEDNADEPGARMSLEVPEHNPGGRPRHGKKPKVEKTFAIPPEIHQRLVSISNHEGIRHDKKFSVSYIMGHLLDFALSHVDGTKVIPDANGDGLVIKKREAVQ
ncbi:hypothetical protein [Rhizobium sp. BK176]|uniref:hypothetical protein n=1 Tax=Rhizobium sp. BK176 TaxID=2587071 RepID=UPI00216831E0|nr:hypothetical protein [Rhizobium sp. BK176]MCS4089845.1 hypothetical protein [Rhizobium sp. BK176]